MPVDNPCKIDGMAATIPHIFCQGCLNNWLRIRQAIQQRFLTQYGPATRENMPFQTSEMNRLNTLWKRDREAFENEAKSWYA